MVKRSTESRERELEDDPDSYRPFVRVGDVESVGGGRVVTC